MKSSERYTLHNVLLALLGVVLLLCIYLAANNAFKTYVSSEGKRQSSLWSILQLNKEMSNVNFKSKLFIRGIASKESLKVPYEILWSRISITHSSLLNDGILSSLSANKLIKLLDSTYSHIKSIETMVLGDTPLNKSSLSKWVVQTDDFNNEIRMSLLNDLISADSNYSKVLREGVFKSVAVLLITALCFIAYLGYLLYILWVQKKHHRYLLEHDSLTRLYSREYMLQRVQSLCDEHMPFTMLIFDINQLKSTNDTLGHLAGDDLLKYLADNCRYSLGQEGIVGRIGGDEFLCVIEGEQQQDVNQCYESLLKLLDEPCSIQGYPVSLSLSTGGSLASESNFNSNLLLERTEKAMIQAKSNAQSEVFWSSDLSRV